MLENQTFTRKPLIVLGRSFFSAPNGEPSYETTLLLRECSRVNEMWDFHFCDLQGTKVQWWYDTVTAWGAPMPLGKLYSTVPKGKDYKSFQRLLISCDRIHSKELCELYRYAGPKNISSISGEKLLLALTYAADDPEPSSLTKHLLRLDSYI